LQSCLKHQGGNFEQFIRWNFNCKSKHAWWRGRVAETTWARWSCKGTNMIVRAWTKQSKWTCKTRRKCSLKELLQLTFRGSMIWTMDECSAIVQVDQQCGNDSALTAVAAKEQLSVDVQQKGRKYIFIFSHDAHRVIIHEFRSYDAGIVIGCACSTSKLFWPDHGHLVHLFGLPCDPVLSAVTVSDAGRRGSKEGARRVHVLSQFRKIGLCYV
jgi:hypothetical protein